MLRGAMKRRNDSDWLNLRCLGHVAPLALLQLVSEDCRRSWAPQKRSTEVRTTDLATSRTHSILMSKRNKRADT
jgi:hypothetical protein